MNKIAETGSPPDLIKKNVFSHRRPTSFSFRDDIAKRLDKYCKKHTTNKSRLVEGLVISFLENQSDKKKITETTKQEPSQ